MSTRYLLRFDDICPTMNWRVWDQVEATLLEHGVAPLLAVVPDNRDSKLQVDPPNPHFWDRVRSWQGRGWTIGLHGYQHTYTSDDAGLLGINPRSEFAGLPYDEQLKKLRSAVEIFRNEAVVPQVWIAPAHSFDAVTLRALVELGIDCVSDGLFLWPHRDDCGVRWIPQQLWRLRRFPLGLWTVCYHINLWTSQQLASFRRDLCSYQPLIGTFGLAVQSADARRKGLLDITFNYILAGALALRRLGFTTTSRGN